MPASNSAIAPSAMYFAGAQWIAAHIDELAARYPNQWVAAFKDRAVAADAELGKAEDAVDQAVPLADVVFQFVDDGTLIFSVPVC